MRLDGVCFSFGSIGYAEGRTEMKKKKKRKPKTKSNHV